MPSKRLTLRYSPEAASDVRDGRLTYEGISQGLGDRFRSAVRDCLELVRAHPEIGERIEGQLRRVLVKKFPYAIFYERKESNIVVYGVIHTARDEPAWRERME